MDETKRVLLVVAYDGTNYHGWQVQPGCVTIEGVLNETLSSLFQEEIQVIGASRTDAGVHAYGNIAVFDTAARIPAEKIPYALNRRLPEDIRIRKAVQVAADFHPRKCESRKTYEYCIWNAEFPLPQKRLYSYWTYYALDVERMRRAAEYLIGEHDFKSFCSVHTQAESTIRRIYDIRVSCEGEENECEKPESHEENLMMPGEGNKDKKSGMPDVLIDGELPSIAVGTGKGQSREIVIRVTGNGFLYNMVRIIAGTLIEVGRGKLVPEDVKKMLEAKNREAGGPTAPACGLTLVEYRFEGIKL